jgi:hypothetical protein
LLLDLKICLKGAKVAKSFQKDNKRVGKKAPKNHHKKWQKDISILSQLFAHILILAQHRAQFCTLSQLLAKFFPSLYVKLN